MIAGLINAFFQLMLNLINKLISVFTKPIDALIAAVFPDLAAAISDTLQFLSNTFGSMIWAMGLIPNTLKTILALILTLELAKYSYYVGIKVITYSYNLIQKVKFW